MNIRKLVDRAVTLETRAETAKRIAFNAVLAQTNMQTRQSEVAERAGISQSYLSEIINGKRGFTTETLVKLEKAILGPRKPCRPRKTPPRNQLQGA
jgi:predicted XRE-type DNA-binding protein